MKARWHWGQNATSTLDVDRKDTKGKPRFSLMRMRELWQVIDVREYGAAKYGNPETCILFLMWLDNEGKFDVK